MIGAWNISKRNIIIRRYVCNPFFDKANNKSGIEYSGRGRSASSGESCKCAEGGGSPRPSLLSLSNFTSLAAIVEAFFSLLCSFRQCSSPSDSQCNSSSCVGWVLCVVYVSSKARLLSFAAWLFLILFPRETTKHRCDSFIHSLSFVVKCVFWCFGVVQYQ